MIPLTTDDEHCACALARCIPLFLCTDGATESEKCLRLCSEMQSFCDMIEHHVCSTGKCVRKGKRSKYSILPLSKSRKKNNLLLSKLLAVCRFLRTILHKLCTKEIGINWPLCMSYVTLTYAESRATYLGKPRSRPQSLTRLSPTRSMYGEWRLGLFTRRPCPPIAVLPM